MRSNVSSWTVVNMSRKIGKPYRFVEVMGKLRTFHFEQNWETDELFVNTTESILWSFCKMAKEMIVFRTFVGSDYQ